MSGVRPRRATAVLLLVAPLVAVGVLPAPSADAATCTPTTATATVTVDTAQPVLGGSLELSGTGWCHPTDGGSRIAVKIDAGAYSRPDDDLSTNRTIWAIVDADASDGTFTASFTLPDGTKAGSTPKLPTGEHTVQLLTGSLKTGDTVRSVASAPFTVTAPGDSDPPSWSHSTISSGGATAWVEDESPTGDGHELRVAGTGWTRTDGRPSVVAVKLAKDPDGGQYQRRGSAVLRDDPTIWAILIPGAGGVLDTSVDLPDDLVAGQYLTVSLLSGKFASGDVQRSATTTPLVVGGVPWDGDDGDPDPTTCTPTSATPTVELGTTQTTYGGTLHLEGAGWCHPTDGGSRIAVKIDDGAYSRLDDRLSTNRTIWAIVEADDSDGTFSADITLPDGTTATSEPALPAGEHTLRLLTGSLVAGDTPRTLESEPFVVGRYRPNGTPDPLDGARLRPRTRHGVDATIVGRQLRVALPRSRPGAWAFVSLYAADGSPRYPWSRWWRVDDHHLLRLPFAARQRAGLTGRLRVVVQSGDAGRVGDLLGWDSLRLERSRVTAGPTSTVAPPTTSWPATPAAPAGAVPPTLAAPEPPVATYADLDPDEHGSVRGATDAGVVTLTVRSASPGDSVFVHVYTPDQVVPAGWASVDADRRIWVDLTAFSGYAGLTVQDRDATLLGWAPVSLGAAAATDETAATADPTPAPTPTDDLTPVAATDRVWIGTADGLLLALGALVLAGVSFGLGLRRRGVPA